MITSALGRLAAGDNLSLDEMTGVMDQVMQGTVPEHEIAVLLTALRHKSETVDEIAGAALAMRRQLHGESHPELAQAVNNLAWALSGLGHVDEAVPLYREALEMKRKLLGDAHPELATGLSNLAFTLQRSGDYAGAELAYRQALAMNRQLLGASHPDVAANMNELAFALRAQGKTRESVTLLRQALSRSMVRASRSG